MTNYTDATENGIERNCARCDVEAAKGSRFCADHAIRTDGGTIAADPTDDQADLGDWEDNGTPETPDVPRSEVARIVRETWTHDPLGDFHPTAAARVCSTSSVVAAINGDH